MWSRRSTLLTSNTPSVNIASAVGTFSGGGTYANLRDLGNGRTLVLLDGQRLAPNAFSGNAVDLSGIPFSAIDSVEVLREGASALYGSDAIAGVINFKTKRNYQGLEVQGNFDHPQEARRRLGRGDLTFGHGDLVSDGYNFMITGSFSSSRKSRRRGGRFRAEGYDPARGVTNTNDPGTWPGTFVDSVRQLLAAELSGLSGQSVPDSIPIISATLLLPVFRRDGLIPGLQGDLGAGVLHQGAAGQQHAAAAVLLHPLRTDRLVRSHVLCAADQRYQPLHPDRRPQLTCESACTVDGTATGARRRRPLWPAVTLPSGAIPSTTATPATSTPSSALC